MCVRTPGSGGGSLGRWSRFIIVLASSSAASLALAGCLNADTKDTVNEQINNGMRTSEVGIARAVAVHVAAEAERGRIGHRDGQPGIAISLAWQPREAL